MSQYVGSSGKEWRRPEIHPWIEGVHWLRKTPAVRWTELHRRMQTVLVVMVRWQWMQKWLRVVVIPVDFP